MLSMCLLRSAAIAVIATAATFCSTSIAQDSPQFTSFDAAKPILQALSSVLPADLRSGPVDSTRWSQWLKTADAAVRRRLEAGEEDTLTNLLRLGVTFTTEYRINDEYFVRYGESNLVNSFAEHRAHDLIQALAAPAPIGALSRCARSWSAMDSPCAQQPERQAAQRYLLANMARMHREFLQAKEQARNNRSRMFQDRGISLDSNLWPDYDLDLQFRRMAEKGMLQQRSIRRVAIVGPGLDFVNKQEGVDFYPPQSVQPFAVLDCCVSALPIRPSSRSTPSTSVRSSIVTLPPSARLLLPAVRTPCNYPGFRPGVDARVPQGIRRLLAGSRFPHRRAGSAHPGS